MRCTLAKIGEGKGEGGGGGGGEAFGLIPRFGGCGEAGRLPLIKTRKREKGGANVLLVQILHHTFITVSLFDPFL